MAAVQIKQAKRIRTFVMAAPSATESTSLVTTGAGVVFAVSVTSTATAAANTYVALYDASAAGTAVYDYVTTATGAARLLTIFQSTFHTGTAAGIAVNTGPHIFPEPIPFFDGLVVAETNAVGTAVGTSSLTIVVSIYAPRTI